eukprot:2670261-Rhodomonas_salina.2
MERSADRRSRLHALAINCIASSRRSSRISRRSGATAGGTKRVTPWPKSTGTRPGFGGMGGQGFKFIAVPDDVGGTTPGNTPPVRVLLETPVVNIKCVCCPGLYPSTR